MAMGASVGRGDWFCFGQNDTIFIYFQVCTFKT